VQSQVLAGKIDKFQFIKKTPPMSANLQHLNHEIQLIASATGEGVIFTC